MSWWAGRTKALKLTGGPWRAEARPQLNTVLGEVRLHHLVAPVRVAEFVSWLPEGSTYPFLANDVDGAPWVVKALRTSAGSKPLVSELVGGAIANWLGLPWPTTAPAMLEEQVYNRFRERFPEAASNVAVAISYVQDLRRIEYQQPGPPQQGVYRLKDDPWLQSIRLGLTRYLSVPGNLEALYGRSTLDNWLLAQDGKIDQLQVLGDRFVLIDASASLGGISWSIAESRVIAPCPYSGWGHSNYTRAAIDRPEPYQPWLDRVQSYPEQHLDACLTWAESWATREQLDLVRSIVLPVDPFVQTFRGVLEGDFFEWPGRH